MGNSRSYHQKPTKKYDAIFFSPHLDDAILSAGNAITALKQQNKTVLIATVFTSALAFPGQDARVFTTRCGYKTPKAFFAARKKEDIHAATLLAADTLHLDFIDAGFRADHPNFATVFTPELTKNDLKLVELVAKSVNQIITTATKPNTQLFFPLGIGWHVDHQIVTLITKKIWQPQKNWQLIFWEDIPYRNVTGATIARQATISEIILNSQPQHIHSSQKVANLKQQAIAAYSSQVESLLATGGYNPSYDNSIECFWYV